MEGLTAKVFRTYNASKKLQDELDSLTIPDQSVPEKMLAYNRANRQVALLCNHQRSVPKTFEKSMETLKAKVTCRRFVCLRTIEFTCVHWRLMRKKLRSTSRSRSWKRRKANTKTAKANRLKSKSVFSWRALKSIESSLRFDQKENGTIWKEIATFRRSSEKTRDASCRPRRKQRDRTRNFETELSRSSNQRFLVRTNDSHRRLPFTRDSLSLGVKNGRYPSKRFTRKLSVTSFVGPSTWPLLIIISTITKVKSFSVMLTKRTMKKMTMTNNRIQMMTNYFFVHFSKVWSVFRSNRLIFLCFSFVVLPFVDRL